MAFIRKRGNKYCVVYKVKDENGIDHQKSETYGTQKEADRRKKERNRVQNGCGQI